MSLQKFRQNVKDKQTEYRQDYALTAMAINTSTKLSVQTHPKTRNMPDTQSLIHPLNIPMRKIIMPAKSETKCLQYAPMQRCNPFCIESMHPSNRPAAITASDVRVMNSRVVLRSRIFSRNQLTWFAKLLEHFIHESDSSE